MKSQKTSRIGNNGGRWILRAGALLALAAGMANAQTLVSCAAGTITPATIRMEGATEQVADLAFSCTLTSAPQSQQAARIQVTMNASVSSVALGSGGATEATAFANSTGVQGTVSNSGGVYTITFASVPVAAYPSTTVNFTVTNIRVNAAGSGLSAGSAITAQAQVTMNSSSSPITTGNATVPLAYLAQGLQPNAGGTASYSACVAMTPASGPAFQLQIGENFVSAFKSQGGSANNTLGSEFTANTETGYYVSAGGANNAAGYGTRIRVLFSGVPGSASVYVPTTITVGGSTLSLTLTESGVFAQVPPISAPNAGLGIPSGLNVAAVTISGGAGEAVYEVTAQNPAAIDTFTVPVYLGATNTQLSGSAITAVAGLAPISSTTFPTFANVDTLTTTASAIAGCSSLAIKPTTLSSAEQGVPYLQQLASSGVTGWSIVNGGGNLPAGLTLNATTGTISGTPTVNGTFPFTVQTAGSSPIQASFTLTVNPPVAITTTTLTGGAPAVNYSQAVVATGGTGTLTWEIVSGGLPSGLSINAATGLISGKTSQTGTFALAVRVYDTIGAAAMQSYSLQITPPTAFCNSASLVSGPVTVRAEGVTELVSGLQVSCTGTGGTANVQVSLVSSTNGSTSLPITSKVLNAGSGTTEAVLVSASSTKTLGTIDGTGTILTFTGVTVPSGSSTFTISNIRVNASAVTAGSGTVTVSAALSSTGTVSVYPANTVVANVAKSFATPQISGVSTFTACAPVTAASPAFSLTFGENTAGVVAFKTQSGETGSAVTYQSVTNQATSGTRVRVIFNNVPSNVNVYVPLTLTATAVGTPSGNPTAVLTLTTSESGAYSAVSAVTPTSGNTLPGSPALGLVTITGGTGEAVYEVTTADALDQNSFTAPVYLVSTGNPLAVSNAMTATVSLAPVGAAANVPNFTSGATALSASAFNFCVNSSALPSAQVGHSYNATVGVTGGTSPYVFTNAAGLPTGLSISSAGVITGTPTVAGPASFTVTITDANSVSGSYTVNMQVQTANPLTITTTSLPVGYPGYTYSQTLQATGGQGSYSWSLSGSLVGTGLSLNSNTGVISGTPSTTGTISLTVHVVDGLGLVATQALTIQVIAVTAPSISTTVLPNGATGSLYAATLAATGGVQPYTWSVTSGAPAWLSLNPSTGAISGTPTQTGTSTITFKVTDSETVAKSASATLTLTVLTSMTLTPVTNGIPVDVNKAFSTTIVVQGGTTPITCSVASGSSLPAGVNLNGSTCGLSGTPTTPGAFTFTLKATDSSAPAQNATQAYTLYVANPLQITTLSLSGVISSATTYTSTLAASGGVPPYSNWVVSSGSLPTSFVLNPSTGVLTGNPSLVTSGSYNFSVTVQDSLGKVSAAQNFTSSGQTPTTTTLSLSSGLMTVGSLETLTATVTPVFAYGQVAFYDGNTELGTSSISVGQAALMTPLLGTGVHLLRAVFIANSTYGFSISAAQPVQVNANGNNGFAAAVNRSVGNAPANMIAGDFNGDGVIDLAVQAANGVNVLPGIGDGTFGTAIVTAMAAAGPMVAADFNNDGLIDIASIGAGNVAIQLGNGDGTFQSGQFFAAAGGAGGTALVSGDFNGDGVADLAALGTSGVGILIGNGGGGFYSGTTLSLSGGTAIAIGDFNQDGYADLAVASSGGTIRVYFGKGDGTFQLPATYTATVTALTVADVNGDGYLDLVTSAGVLPGSANGTFGALKAYPSSATGIPAVSDFNGDGMADVLLTNYTSGGTSVNILQGKGDGTFVAPVAYTVGTGPVVSVVADFNRDGSADFVTANSGSNNVSVVLARLPLSLSSITLPAGAIGSAYSATLTATGGTTPYTFALASGSALPAGLTLSSTGVITGTPTSVGATTFSVVVTDSTTPANTTQPVAFTIVVGLAGSGGGGGGTSGGGGAGGGVPGAIVGTLSASTTSLTYNIPVNVASQTQTLTLTYTYAINDPPLFQTSAKTANGVQWLSISPSSGVFSLASYDGTTYTFTATVSVTAVPSFFSAGNSFAGTFTLTSAGTTIPGTVVMNVTDAARFSASPQSLGFNYQQGSALPAPQTVTISSVPTGVTYTASVSTVSGGQWLSIPSSATHGTTSGPITVSATPGSLAVGTYIGQLTITPSAGSSLVVPVSLTVAPLTPPKISVTPASQIFALTQGGAAATGQLSVSDTGGGTLQFAATADCSWIRFTGGATGSAVPGSPAPLGFTVDPTGLGPQLYTCHITVKDTASASDPSQVATVTLVVSSGGQTMTLSQSGLTFNAAANGPQPLGQSFTLSNTGASALSWTASAQIIQPAGTTLPNWLTVSTPSGTLGAQSATPVTVSVNIAGLAPGQYYGSVNVSAPGAANSPQTVSVLLNVQPAQGVPGGIQLSTGGLILTGTAGSSSTVQQQISMFNPGSNAVSFTITSPVSWLTAVPAAGSLNSGVNPVILLASLAGLSAGPQTATLNVSFGDGTTAQVQVLLLATSTGSAGHAIGIDRPLATGACSSGAASYLAAVFSQPASQLSLQASVAQRVVVQIVDDCGKAVTARNGGAAQVTFNNGDPTLNLVDIGGGLWEGTWTPANAAAAVTLQLLAKASSGTAVFTGSATASVAVQPITAAAAALPTGIANAASGKQATATVVTPGAYVAIYGAGLAGNGAPAATSIPLPTSLNGTQVLLGNQPLPLSYAGGGQINGVVPQGLAANTQYDLVIQRGATQSVAVPLTVARYQPGVYTVDASGSGQGVVEIAGTTLLAGPTAPGYRPVVSGSEYITVFATGLGPVNDPKTGQAPPADGAGAPLSPIYQTTATVTATIGGVNAPVAFAGLTPTLVALYQVNVQVPAGVPTGSAVPLVLTVTDPATGATYQSNTTTIAIQ